MKSAVSTSHDAVLEVLDRLEHKPKIAWGEVGGRTASISRELSPSPTLVVRAGGEVESPDDAPADHYGADVKMTFEYGRVQSAVRDYEMLCDEYGLTEEADD